MKSLALAVLSGLSALPALAQSDEITTVTYACERGAEVLASYLHIADRALVVLTVEGRHLVLDSVPSASGAKYLTTGDQPVHVWWTKGDGASLLAGKDEVGIYLDCLAVPQG